MPYRYNPVADKTINIIIRLFIIPPVELLIRINMPMWWYYTFAGFGCQRLNSISLETGWPPEWMLQSIQTHLKTHPKWPWPWPQGWISPTTWSQAHICIDYGGKRGVFTLVEKPNGTRINYDDKWHLRTETGEQRPVICRCFWGIHSATKPRPGQLKIRNLLGFRLISLKSAEDEACPRVTTYCFY